MDTITKIAVAVVLLGILGCAIGQVLTDSIWFAAGKWFFVAGFAGFIIKHAGDERAKR